MTRPSNEGKFALVIDRDRGHRFFQSAPKVKKEGKMKKEKKEIRKTEYKKPMLTKHKKLRDVTAGITGGLGPGVLGCTKNF